MSIPPQLLQFAGSLIAILVLAWLVKRLGLGATPKLETDEQTIAYAEQVSDDFSAVAVARDADGQSALLRDANGKIMLLKAHGVHFAGRILTSAASARSEGSRVVIASGEQRFGTVALAIEDASTWAEAINGLDSTSNA